MSGRERDTDWAPGFHSLTTVYRGRNARIYRAVHTSTQAPVALKVMMDVGGFMELARLRDLGAAPGLVSLLDAGRSASGEPYMALPFCPDGSYAQILAQHEPLELSEVAAVGRAIASALTAVHAHGLLHNEVVPGNILRAGSSAVLIDFASSDSIGTPPARMEQGAEVAFHTPPESLRGEPGSTASDVYQLASSLWTLLAGRTPFANSDGTPLQPDEHARRVMTAPVPSVPRTDIPDQVNEVLTRALAKHANDRYATPGELAADLEQARVASPISPTAPRTAAPSTADPVEHRDDDGPGANPYSSRSASARLEARYGLRAGGHSRNLGDKDRYRAPLDAEPQPSPSVTVQEFAGEDPANSTTDPAPRSTAQETAEILTEHAWSHLQGWTGTAESALLPAASKLNDSVSADKTSDPEYWYPPVSSEDPLRWRRHLHIAAAVVSIAVLSGAIGTIATMRSGPGMADADTQAAGTDSPKNSGKDNQKNEDKRKTTAKKVPSPAQKKSNDTPRASSVWLKDNGSSVRVNWSDESDGQASYYVLGAANDRRPTTMASTGTGVESAEVDTPNVRVEYCFTVVAVDGTATPAAEVCTERAEARAQAQREQAQKEKKEKQKQKKKEREKKEKQGESPDSSPSPSGDADK